MGEQAAVTVPKEQELWLPSTATRGSEVLDKQLVVVLGPSGSGKSHLLRQLALDKGMVEAGILAIMSEDSTSTVGADALPNIWIERRQTPQDVMKLIEDLVRARASGKRLPGVVFWDSISGAADYGRRYYEKNPILSRDEKSGQTSRNTFREFGERGYGVIDVLIEGRDNIPGIDFVATATTFEGSFSPIPELSVDGKLIPKNLTRLSSACLYLRSEKLTFDPETDKESVEIAGDPPPHMRFERNAKGALTGVCIKRMFTVENTGEVSAKPHRNLAMREPQDLPNVLRRLHGKETVKWWKQA